MDKTLILNDIKKHIGLTSSKDFADFLGIKPTTLSMWYSRNTFDIELVFKKCEFLNSEWLLTGKGPMIKEKQEQSTSKTKEDHSHLLDLIEYQKKHIAELKEQISELKKEYTVNSPVRMVAEPPEQLKK